MYCTSGPPFEYVDPRKGTETLQEEGNCIPNGFEYVDPRKGTETLL